jgi:hypothetical protein
MEVAMREQLEQMIENCKARLDLLARTVERCDTDGLCGARTSVTLSNMQLAFARLAALPWTVMPRPPRDH